MSSDTRKKIVRRFKKTSKKLLNTALTRGADNIGKELLGAVNDVNQPSDVLFDKLITALKSGAIATGQEIMQKGIRSR